jgi:hypothetical protein
MELDLHAQPEGSAVAKTSVFASLRFFPDEYDFRLPFLNWSSRAGRRSSSWSPAATRRSDELVAGAKGQRRLSHSSFRSPAKLLSDDDLVG